ncbi:MAG: tryptophan synthase subunit alpha [Alphaproteobacteria bacterium]|nr:tryptophan synthase subunit alpha [Alphaproteobacteria bacterium]
MSRIEQKFAALRKEGRAALITFIMSGDPDLETSFEVLKSLPENGADIIEIGMPFTDPAADGVTIQKAGLRALKAGMTLRHTLEMVTKFRKTDTKTPIILMGYANPLFAFGMEKFAKAANKAGVDGLIIVDLPPEEDCILRDHAKDNNLDIIRLITPTTDERRLPKVLEGASGFLYYVSITGVTGAAKPDPNALKPHITQIKSQTDLPVVIGFGIKTPDDAKTMSGLADGIVVGSSIVEKIALLQEDKSKLGLVGDFVKSLSSALK